MSKVRPRSPTRYKVYPNDVFAYTGFRPSAELRNYITDNGGALSSKMNDDVTHLIVKKRGKKKTKKELNAEYDGGIAIIALDSIDRPSALKKPVKEYRIPSPVSFGCRPGTLGSSVYSGPLLLAKNYKKRDGSNVVDPTGWWASEKLDGYRALWDGSKFLTRTGKDITVPTWFSELMPPSVALDGELWMGRGKFRDCGLFRRKEACPVTWANSNVMFSVFDMPSSSKLFEERMEDLKDLIEDRCECRIKLELPEEIVTVRCPIQIAEQVRVKNAAHLDKMFQSVVSNEGEGMMIRKPKSKYEAKRSHTLLKYKATYDTECKIIGYKPGSGKNKGLLGAFRCELLKGKKVQFNVSGMTDKIRENYKRTHPVGTVITILFNDCDPISKIPRHPRYLRVKDDF